MRRIHTHRTLPHHACCDVRCHVHFFSIGCSIYIYKHTVTHLHSLVLAFFSFMNHFLLFFVVFVAAVAIVVVIVTNITTTVIVRIFAHQICKPSLPLSFHFVHWHNNAFQVYVVHECVSVCFNVSLHYNFFSFFPVSGRNLFEIELKLICWCWYSHFQTRTNRIFNLAKKINIMRHYTSYANSLPHIYFDDDDDGNHTCDKHKIENHRSSANTQSDRKER